jgi:hypothetical protein
VLRSRQTSLCCRVPRPPTLPRRLSNGSNRRRVCARGLRCPFLCENY